MTAQLPRFDLGRSLSSALKALQQSPAASSSALPQQSTALPGSSQMKATLADTSASRPATENAFEKTLSAARDAASQGQARPRGTFVNFTV